MRDHRFSIEAFLTTLVELEEETCSICENACVCEEICEAYRTELGTILQTKPQSYNSLGASLC